MTRAFRIGVLAACGITVALTPRGPASIRGAEACGPIALDYAFVRIASPENPQAYAAGAIGVVRPSFRLPWLVTAYRYFPASRSRPRRSARSPGRGSPACRSRRAPSSARGAG